MKTISTLSCVAAACAAVVLSGCVVVPAGAEPGYYGAQGGVVYVAPTYAVPGAGYAWQHHAQRGWGWRHPHHGWHRGWR